MTAVYQKGDRVFEISLAKAALTLAPPGASAGERTSIIKSDILSREMIG